MTTALSGIKPTGTLHLGNYLGMIRPALALAARSERSFYFVRPRRGVNFIGFADSFEGSRANGREAEWKCKRKEATENGLPGDADTAKSHEDSQSCADFVAKTRQYGRRQIDTVIRCFS